MSEKKIFVTVDTIEGDKASLLLRGDEEETPFGIFSLSMLPEEVEVGDILSVVFEREVAVTNEVRERVRQLHEKLMKRK